MGWGGAGGFGGGGSFTGGVGTGTVMADQTGAAGGGTVLADSGEAAKGSKLKDFMKQAGDQLGKGGGGGGAKTGGGDGSGDAGSGSTLAAKREVGVHPEATHLGPAPAREGFSRLAEMGPRSPKNYGTP